MIFTSKNLLLEYNIFQGYQKCAFLSLFRGKNSENLRHILSQKGKFFAKTEKIGKKQIFLRVVML